MFSPRRPSLTALTVIACLFAFSAFAQVRVVKSALARNPKVLFRGIAGDSTLSTVVGNDLRNCGWFEVVSGGGADYAVSGSAAGGALTLQAVDAGDTAVFAAKAGADKASAHRLVDALIKKLFNVRGICSSKIAFALESAKGYKDIYICDFDGSNIKRVSRNRTLCVEPGWTPGCASVVYTMYGPDRTDVVETELRSFRSRRLAQFPGLNSGAAVSPNGKVLALILSKDGQVELYIKNLAKAGMKRLTNGRSVESSPCWSPDGRRICFVSDMGGRPNLYLINADGGGLKRLPTSGGEAASPSWSSDNQIAYSAKMGRNYAIAVLDLSGRKPGRIITNAAGDWENPSWAPDNRHLVCGRALNGRGQLYVVDSWTGKSRPLFNSKYNTFSPSWSPK